MKHKRNKKRNNSNRGSGPKAADDERLWKRIIPHVEDFDFEFVKREIVDLLERKEGLTQKHSQDKTERNRYESKILTTLAQGITKAEKFVPVNGKIRIRGPEEVIQIQDKKVSWEAFFSRHSRPEISIKGAFPLRRGEEYLRDGKEYLVSDSDAQKYFLIEEIMMSVLEGKKASEWPDNCFLHIESKLTKWDGFDLEKEIYKFISKRSGLRFANPGPHCALLLHSAGKISTEELFEKRLLSLKQEQKNPFPRQWDQRHVDSQNGLPEVDGDAEVAKGRTDLRHLPFMTIDPHDAKDFDDAVCLIENEDERCLWVAIADVAHYVVKDSALDNAALNRATSVYLPHTVLPMLPPRLADDLCSLRAGVDRLAMVVAMHLDKGGNITETIPYEAVIHVSENLAYEDALEQERFLPMMELSELWRSKEIRLDINTAEVRPRIKESGIDLKIKWPNKATQMIESFMVATNSAVAHLLGSSGASVPYRCHSPPDRPEVTSLNAKISALGIGIELPMPSHRKSGQDESDELNDLLSSWAGGDISIDLPNSDEEISEENYMSNVIDSEARKSMLRALSEAQIEASKLDGMNRRIIDAGLFQLMQRAIYSKKNMGHFGLDLDAYLHFTSPIRRYPDLVVHRQLKALVHKEEWAYSEEEISELSAHCSQRGWESKKIEWELVANAFHIYLLEGGKIGSVGGEDVSSIHWPARVSALRNPWVFLDLVGDGSIQGRMHLRQLSKYRTTIDEHGIQVVPAEPDKFGRQEPLISLGQKYPCRLQGVDIWSGQMDLAPLK